MHMSAFAATWFAPFALVIGIWVSWSDMKFMKIPNQAVLALAAVFILVGPLVLPFHSYLWHLTAIPAVLAIGFLLNVAGAVGAGDAKFAAAMAPFFALGDAVEIMFLSCAILLAALTTHRLMGLVPAVRRATGDWESWERRDFPMGFALSGILIFYLGLATHYGA
jgi:prepilin peptidase CpaA